MQHTRVIYPVGQGGFAVEFIGDMCGLMIAEATPASHLLQEALTTS